MDLSIIVPVYNVQKYLKECLESLLKENLDYEIIVVNDGSTDLSQPIIDNYVAKYPFIHSLIKPNGGLSDARNYGLKFAKGDYITFLDSDDYIVSGGYTKMVNLAKLNNHDLVVADLKYFYEDDLKEPLIKEGINKVSDNINKSLFLSPLFSWNKIYRRDFFASLNILYPKGLWYEDIPVTLKAFAMAKNIGYLNEVIYNYRQRSNSIMSSSYNDKMYDIFTIFEIVYADFKKNNLLDKYYDELEYLFLEHFLVYGAFRFLRCEKPYYKTLMKKAFKFTKLYFPNLKKNKYIKQVFNSKTQIFIKTNNPFLMHFWHLYLRSHR